MAASRHAPIAATHPCRSLHRTDAGVILNPGHGDNNSLHVTATWTPAAVLSEHRCRGRATKKRLAQLGLRATPGRQDVARGLLPRQSSLLESSTSAGSSSTSEEKSPTSSLTCSDIAAKYGAGTGLSDPGEQRGSPRAHSGR